MIAWFHCFAGIAGDMALGSLLDAGADADEVVALLRRIPVSGWSLRTEPVLRGGVGATQAIVTAAEGPIVRTHAHIVGLIEEARLPPRVRDRSLAVFARLAEAEGRVHRKPAAHVHFHEVGGLDAIVDVVGTCAALEALGVDEVAASPVATGLGMVRTAHGLLPNPAPAVVQLLRDVPTYGREVTVELTTPTGAAILAALATSFGPMPAMSVRASGFGAGGRELDGLPNATQVVLGERGPGPAGSATAATGVAAPEPGQPAVLLEANVDDVTGEVLAHTIAVLLEAGAHDAWITPVVMKKGRPGHVVSALVDPALAGQVARALTSETGTLGVRGRAVDRWPSPRSIELVDVDGLPVRVKVGPGRVKAEHDDAADVARRTGRPLREVSSLAEAAWRRRQDDTER